MIDIILKLYQINAWFLGEGNFKFLVYNKINLKYYYIFSISYKPAYEEKIYKSSETDINNV